MTDETIKTINEILYQVKYLGEAVPKHARNIHHFFGHTGGPRVNEAPDFDGIREINRKLADRIEQVWNALSEEEKRPFKNLVTHRCCAVLCEHRGHQVLADDHEEVIEKTFEKLK